MVHYREVREGHTPVTETEQAGSNPQMPEWLDISGNRRSTMKKTLILTAFAAALSLGAGAAMADGADPANDYWGAKNLEMISRQPAPRTNSTGDYHSFRVRVAPVQSDAGTVGGDGSGG
jgi:hypothetical protein